CCNKGVIIQSVSPCFFVLSITILSIVLELVVIVSLDPLSLLCHLLNAVILFTGNGVPVAGYVRLQRLLGASLRIYFYDRAGYNVSEQGPVEVRLTAQRNARGLQTLLVRIAVAPR
ncbi:hypothetical protein LTR35_016460, partial [Friedmanniomyces endolithicus]